MSYELHFATIGSFKIRYLDVGTGPTVVLIHGLAGDYLGWQAQIELLKPKYRVIAFDNRGAGASTQIDEPLTLNDLALDTLGLMDHVGANTAHVVGRSMGGAIAQFMALNAPERVRSLTLCASFAKVDPVGCRVLSNMREALEWRGSWADHARHSVQNFVSPKFFNENPERITAIERLIGGETRLPACYSRQNEAIQQTDTRPMLSRITQPALVMAGDVDIICSMTATRELVDGLPNVRSEIFTGAGHFFLMEQPAKFNQHLVDWLDSQA